MAWQAYCIMNTEQSSKNIFTYKQHYQCNISQDNNDEAQKQHLLGLPYKSHKGEKGSTQWENG